MGERGHIEEDFQEGVCAFFFPEGHSLSGKVGHFKAIRCSAPQAQNDNPIRGKSKTGKRCISGVEARVSYVRERVRERAYDILFL